MRFVDVKIAFLSRNATDCERGLSLFSAVKIKTLKNAVGAWADAFQLEAPFLSSAHELEK
jgi:hypothetical protein